MSFGLHEIRVVEVVMKIERIKRVVMLRISILQINMFDGRTFIIVPNSYLEAVKVNFSSSLLNLNKSLLDIRVKR
jgi:ribosomal protein S4E